MKKIVALMLALLFLIGCVKADTVPKDRDAISVIATIFPAYDFAREIAGDKASVRQLLPAGSESHTYEPAPRDIIAIENCDLFICTGGEGDVWIDGILKSMGDKAPTVLKMTDCVELIEAEPMEGEHHHHGDGHRHDFDEHVWTSPKNAVKISRAIAQKLSETDGENEGYYSERLSNYTKKLDELDAKLEGVVRAAKHDTIVVGDRFPFLYLAKHYGLRYHAAFSACGSEGDASAATIASLADKAEELDIPAVLYIEFSNHRIADAIAETAGIKTALLHSCHNVSEEQLADGVSYLTLMRDNIKVLSEVLN